MESALQQNRKKQTNVTFDIWSSVKQAHNIYKKSCVYKNVTDFQTKADNYCHLLYYWKMTGTEGSLIWFDAVFSGYTF